MILEFVNKSPNENPSFSDKGSSGFDLRAWITEETEGFLNENKKYTYILKPFERKMIHTGLYFNVPEHCEIQVRPRSGQSLKKGLSCANCVGTIDADYRAEIGVILINHGLETAWIEDGERIAQFILNKVERIEWNQVTSLDKTDRNGGFGSTDK